MRRALLPLMLILAGCRATSQQHGIVLVPIGPVRAELLERLARELPPILRRSVTIAAPIAPPRSAFDPQRRQYLGEALLQDLAQHDVATAERVIGIIGADAYAPGLNFIFGQARLPGRFAVVAVPRLRTDERVVKETVHELGHTFGFTHCPDERCVMHFSNSIVDTDHKTATFCKRHTLPTP